MTDRTDSEIIAASFGAPYQFGEIFDRYFSTIHGYLARRVGASGADDTASDVFRIAFESRSRFRLEAESALPWLYGIAANVLRTHRRSAGRRQRLVVRSAQAVDSDRAMRDGPLEATLRSEQQDDVVRAIGQIPEVFREPLLLFAWEELSYREIAEVLDIPIGTVQSRINTARRKLKEQLQSIGQEVTTTIDGPKGGGCDA